jgi:diguanylate cyclase (GGDEF)-like protein
MVSLSFGRCDSAAAMVLVVAAAPITALAVQAGNLPENLDALSHIPAPTPMVISPGTFAAYGALITAVTLTTLYVYRGRAFIVYWIGGWLLFAASLTLLARGYDDIRLGSVMIGLAQLLAVWSAGLTLLAAQAFPDDALRWNVPLKVSAASAVWFLAAPLVLSLRMVLSTGPAASAILFAWAAVRYLRLIPRTRYVGVTVIGAGMILLCFSNVAATAVALNRSASDQAFNALVGFNIVVYMFVALGMHVLVFEDMTVELRRANRELAHAHQEVKRLVITDALTGCHNRRFFEEIERREFQRHQRYGAPLSVVFVDVNNFKQLNDTMGHDMGDEVLRTLGALLRRHVRESDYVIRWGGDEFVLILTCATIEAERKAGELKAAFEQECRDSSLPGGIGLSVGVASASQEAQSLVEAVRLADTRMYRDKAGERGGSFTLK